MTVQLAMPFNMIIWIKLMHHQDLWNWIAIDHNEGQGKNGNFIHKAY